MRGQARSNLLLLMTAIIWGSAFIAQSKGADVIGPFTFNTVRYALAVVALLPVIYIFSRKRNSENTVDQDIPKANGTKTLIIGGIATGIALFTGEQQARTYPNRKAVRECTGKCAGVVHVRAFWKTDDIALSRRLCRQGRERERTTD